MNIRTANPEDLDQIQNPAIAEWSQFKSELTTEDWSKLQFTLQDKKTFTDLMMEAEGFVCENEQNNIIAVAFLVPSGHPTDIYTEQQAYIRFVTVAKEYSGQRLGQKLTEAARHIYEKLGFKIIKELEPRLGKKYWLYELTL